MNQHAIALCGQPTANSQFDFAPSAFMRDEIMHGPNDLITKKPREAHIHQQTFPHHREKTSIGTLIFQERMDPVDVDHRSADRPCRPRQSESIPRSVRKTYMNPLLPQRFRKQLLVSIDRPKVWNHQYPDWFSRFHSRELPRRVNMHTPNASSILRLYGILSRPTLTGNHARALGKLNSARITFPLIPATAPLWPLYHHHLERLAITPPFDGFSLEKPRVLVGCYHSARRCLFEALRILQESGIRRALLFKGAALSPLYPSPALRQMSDADIALLPDERLIAEAALQNAGWALYRFQDSRVVRHPSGFLLDSHPIEGDVAHAIFERATPHPVCPAPACIPSLEDHLMIIACHAAENRGFRIWRDVCDAHLLIDSGARGMSCEGWGNSSRVALAALLHFLNQHSPPSKRGLLRLPELDRQERHRAAVLYHAYRHVAVWPGSPVALRMLLPLRGLISQPWMFAGGLHRSRANPGDSWFERDPVLGDLPVPGDPRRHLVRLHALLSLMKSGRFCHYWRVLGELNAIPRITTPFKET